MKDLDFPLAAMVDKIYSCPVCGSFLCVAVDCLVCPENNLHTNLILKEELDYRLITQSEKAGLVSHSVLALEFIGRFLRRDHEVRLCLRERVQGKV